MQKNSARVSFLSFILSFVLVLSLFPIVPNLAFALPETDSNPGPSTTQADYAEDEVIIVYEDDVIGLDEDLGIDQGIQPAALAEEVIVEEVQALESDQAEDQVEATEEATEATTSYDEDQASEVYKPSVAVELPSTTEEEAAIDPEVTLRDLGVIDQQVVDEDDSVGVATIAKLDESVSVEEAIESLQDVPGISSVMPNYFLYPMDYTPNDPNYSRQSYLANTTYGTGFSAVWQSVKVRNSVTIAVVDSGCNLNHPDLAGVVNTTQAWDATVESSPGSNGRYLRDAGVANNGDSYTDANGTIGHGTMVCGTLGAQTDNRVGIAGASFNASILPVRVFDNNNECKTSYLLNALNRLIYLKQYNIVSNLRVVNISLGGYQDLGALVHSKINQLYSMGISIVCSGGNGTGPTMSTPMYPSDYSECISVTSTTSQGKNSTFSDYNSSKDIAAPGEYIYTTTSNGSYGSTSGTSFSAPLVSAACALLYTYNGNLTPYAVSQALIASATPINYGPNEAKHPGAQGILNANNALKYLQEAAKAQSVPTAAESRYSAVYDYSYYAEHNADVVRAFGDDRSAYLNHFLTYGMSEGRVSSPTFDVVSYHNLHQDLRAAFGMNVAAYYMHYIDYGAREGRKCTGANSQVQSFVSSAHGTNWSRVYDGASYYSRYSDLRAAFGRQTPSGYFFDDSALLNHFLDNGMREGRISSPNFDVVSYHNLYPDLRAAFGMDVAAYYRHYVVNGAREGRKCTGANSQIQSFTSVSHGRNWAHVYDGSYYFNKYADLRAAFGRQTSSGYFFDDYALLNHFVTNGMREGRQASASFNPYYYRTSYRDLNAAFGGNLEAYYIHFLDYGFREGRKAA